MPGDYSRRIFDRRKHYAGVLMQQGRVQLDADSNAQLALQLYRTETESTDVIGASGVPKHHPGFEIAAAAGGLDFTISPGRMYVDGLLCELDAAATYTVQPHYPNPDFTAPAGSPASGSLQLALPDGTYLVYLDAWLREITARDDRLIREVALGGPDTTARLQTVYQVRLLPLTAASPLSPPGCGSAIADFDGDTGLSTGTLNARTQPPQDPNNPCVLPPTAGYSRLENQLYRVEIHAKGPRGTATFKWSRDNASVETVVLGIAGNVVTVADVGPDDVLGFAGGQWVEIVDEESTLKRQPNPLAQIDAIDPATREITLKTSVSSLAGRQGLKLRRWDQSGASAAAAGVSTSLQTWIDLEGGVQVRFSATGDYRSGDYWLIPARTATGEIEWPPFEIPNTAPQPQPARGVRHHLARLAIADVVGGTITIREDCRKAFPPLTEICAEDVCFDNNQCSLAGAETVQQAIDRLCQERDLRFHKKHLHGWGIVCGLQVVCGPGSRSVTVRKGYAISCEGDDIRITKDETVDLFDLIATEIGIPGNSPLSSPLTMPDTEVCLILDSNPSSAKHYHVELAGAHPTGFTSIFKGTLLLDFFEECIGSLVEFFKGEFTPQPGEENLPVGPTMKRVTTFLNLLIELINTQNGAFVFLSGQKNKSGTNFEDTILRNFYAKLRQKLQSQTFCAMFEGARPFPDYPYAEPGITTIFGKGLKTRIRLAPSGKVAYTVGGGTTINVFDLVKGEMAAELTFPGGPSAVVQDVAVSRDGKELYATGLINNRDTMFAIADISGGGLVHTFRNATTMICDQLLVTLGTTKALDTVFAISKGTARGLYAINPKNVDPNITPMYAFNAVGHLCFDADGKTGFATKSSGAAVTNTYDRVLRLGLDAVVQNPPEFTLQLQAGPMSGTDDIAFGQTDGGPQLYVVVDPASQQSNKHVAIYSATDVAKPPKIVDLGQNTTIRLLQNTITHHMMVAYEDIYRVGMLDPKDTLLPDFVPVQIGPISMATGGEKPQVYVLNYWSNTISAINPRMFEKGGPIPLGPLVTYRAGVLNAYADLFGGLLQYLKDCFCDHLLVDCPTCDDQEKIELACISIKNNKVFKVCNFSHRKYVHTFPTWEYWLSIVPVLPLVKQAVEKICCAALPGFFGRYAAPTPQPPENTSAAAHNKVESAKARTLTIEARQTDFKGMVLEQLSKFTGGSKIVTDAFIRPAPGPDAPPSVTHTDISGTPVVDAKQKLEAARINVVREVAYDPANAPQSLGRFVTSPARLSEGDNVSLVTQNGKVLYYTREPAASGDVAALQKQLDASTAESAQLRQQLTQLGADLKDRDTRIAALESSVQLFRTSVQTTTDLQARLDKLEKRLPG